MSVVFLSVLSILSDLFCCCCYYYYCFCVCCFCPCVSVLFLRVCSVPSCFILGCPLFFSWVGLSVCLISLLFVIFCCEIQTHTCLKRTLVLMGQHKLCANFQGSPRFQSNVMMGMKIVFLSCCLLILFRLWVLACPSAIQLCFG